MPERTDQKLKSNERVVKDMEQSVHHYVDLGGGSTEPDHEAAHEPSDEQHGRMNGESDQQEAQRERHRDHEQRPTTSHHRQKRAGDQTAQDRSQWRDAACKKLQLVHQLLHSGPFRKPLSDIFFSLRSSWLNYCCFCFSLAVLDRRKVEMFRYLLINWASMSIEPFVLEDEDLTKLQFDLKGAEHQLLPSCFHTCCSLIVWSLEFVPKLDFNSTERV